MGKIILIIVIVALVVIGIYYGRFFFTKKTINEELPGNISGQNQTIASGSFVDIDFLHKGSGSAKILQDEEGYRLLRFENFKVTNGPDLYVYLTRNSKPTNLKSLGEFINLGRLKGTEGSQNYDLKGAAEDYKTIVIWCQQFGALFSFATLE